MKSPKTLNACLFLVIVLLSMSAYGEKTNVLTNPGFETGNTTGWSPRGSASISVTTEPNFVRSGSYACTVYNRTANWNGLQRDLIGEMIDGETYYIEAYVKSSAPVGADCVMGIRYVDDSTDTYTWVGNSAAVNSDTWTKLSGSFTLNIDGTLDTMYLYFDTQEGSSPFVDIYVDDVVVYGNDSPVPPVEPNATGTIDTTTRYQEIEGFGAAVAWYENYLTSHQDSNELYDLFFDELGLDIYRIRNVYGHSGADVYLPTTGEIVSAAKLRNPDLKVLLSAWAPPDGIKAADANTLGKDPNTSEYLYSEFADWWYDSLVAFEANGVDVNYISIQNEPDFESASWGTCRLDPTENENRAGYYEAFDAVWSKLDTELGAAKPKMLAPEAAGLVNLQDYLPVTIDANNIYGYAHHLYNINAGDNPESYEYNMYDLALNYGDKPLFQTEYEKTTGVWPDALNMAHLLHNSLAIEGVTSYLYWEMFWNSPNIGLVTIQDYNASSYTINSDFYGFKHFSGFVDSGWQRVAATTDSSGLLMSAYISPDDTELAVIVINPTDETDIETTLDFTGLTIDSGSIYRTTSTQDCNLIGSFTPGVAVTFPTESVTTLVLSAPARTLSVSSGTGGSVTTPGEGYFEYANGFSADIIAEPNNNYHFTNWTGTAVDANKVVDVNAASTTVVVDANYTVVANFDSAAPILDSIGAKEVNEGSLLTFDVNATDIDSSTLTYSSPNLPSGATLDANTGTFSWTPTYEQQGDYEVTFVVGDGIAEDSETITITVINTNQPPILDAIGDKSVDEMVLLTFDVNATDNDSNTITYSSPNLPSGATLDANSGTFSWTPDYEDAGDHDVTFVASDGIAEDSETITITVNNINRPPVLGAIGDKTIAENALLSFTVTADDPDNDDTLTYSATGLPSGATLGSDTGAFSWTPDFDQAGVYDVNFTVSDGTDTDSEEITITVTNTNRAPVLDAIGDKTVYTNILLAFDVNATDPDGDSMTYSATNLPSGADFNSPSFSWTPDSNQTGDYDVTFTVDDGNDTDFEIVTITVVPDTDPPVVGNMSPDANSIQAAVDTLIQLRVSDAGTGVDANTVTIEVESDLVYTGDSNDYSSAFGRCRRTGTAAAYTYSYQADDKFTYDQDVTVVVNATDLGGEVMDPCSYTFTTEMRSFGNNKLVSRSTTGSADGSPATIADSSGNIWAVWHTGASGSRDVYVGKLSAGANTFSASTVVTNDPNDQMNPVIGIDGSDNLYVAWQDNSSGIWDVYISTSADGETWSAATQISDPNSNQTNPAIAVDGSDIVYVTWQDDAAGNSDIYVASSADSYANSTQVTSDTAEQTYPDITIDDSNTVYIVWMDTRNGNNDIYGADSTTGPWTNVAIVNNANGQSRPVIATEATGTVLHFAWVDDTGGDNDVYYANNDGLPGSALTGSTLIDDTGEAQTSPAIVVTGSAGSSLKVFVCWRDARNTDTDIYFVQANSDNAANVLVGDDGTNASQSSPAMYVDADGYPYMVWVDGRNTNNNIYYAGSTFVSLTAIDSAEVVAATGATVGVPFASIDDLNDVSVEIPAGACPYDVNITVSRINNPQYYSLDFYGIPFEFSPSGLVFDSPVTIRIPFDEDEVGSSPSAYWYDLQTGLLSQEGISNVSVQTAAGSGVKYLQFQTTHFTTFLVGGMTAAVGGGGGGGGGGCSMSANSDCNIVAYMLPYIALAVIVVILRVKDRRNRKIRMTKEG